MVCDGYNLDNQLAALLQKPKFLANVLLKFLCIFIENNFELQNDLLIPEKKMYKKILIDFLVEQLNENPIFDIALIVYMRSRLSRNLNDDQKSLLGVTKFTKEPRFHSFNGFSQSIAMKINVLDFDYSEKTLYTFDNIDERQRKENPDSLDQIDLGYYDGGFKILYPIAKVNSFFFDF